MKAEETHDRLCEIQDAVNSLNKQVNAQVNHGDAVTPENTQDFIDYFDLFFNNVHFKYEKFKAALKAEQ